MSKIIHNNPWDCIVGEVLEGRSRRIKNIDNAEPIIFGNDRIYEIQRIGGKVATCDIIKTTNTVPHNLRQLNIFSGIDDILQGDSLYCECDECNKKLIHLSSTHRGILGTFKSNIPALSFVLKRFSQTGNFSLTENFKITEVRDEII